MTNQEWEKRMDELRDAQLVTQRLMELNEKRWDARFEVFASAVERHENEIAQLRSAHANDVAELRSAMMSLIAHIDRLIQGQQPNGH